MIVWGRTSVTRDVSSRACLLRASQPLACGASGPGCAELYGVPRMAPHGHPIAELI